MSNWIARLLNKVAWINPWRRFKFLSRELVCLHEAGHIVTALRVGANVRSVELFLHPHPYAKTSVVRDPNQALLIACSGFAVEWGLYKKKRLLNSSGNLADGDETFTEALRNASVDMKSFENALVQLGIPYTNIQDEFIGTALVEVLPKLDFDEVERFAKTLCVKGKLDKKQIDELADSTSKSWWSRFFD